MDKYLIDRRKMNFRSYQLKIIEKIESALLKQKLDLVNDFKEILNNANSLYKTGTLVFWIETINSTNVSEIPITKYGHAEAIRECEHLREYDRHKAEESILKICELLFTYSNEDDCCELQGDYYYYFSLSHERVFKISALGSLKGMEREEIGKYRIAYVSDLKINATELLG